MPPLLRADTGLKQVISIAAVVKKVISIAAVVSEKMILRRNLAGSCFVDPSLAGLKPDPFGLGPYDCDYQSQLRNLQW
ncbi:hypothetical protein COCNU_scaffold004235G000020 [Cocos nucifera]|nr:hypothetical protein [Cocos nucifera]